MKRIIKILLLLFVWFTVKSQSPAPAGLPSPYSTSWYRIGWIQGDSGEIPAYRDTNWIPRFQGTEILWMRTGIDTTKWRRKGNKWVQEFTPKFINATSPILYNSTTGNISCPTCAVGGGIATASNGLNAVGADVRLGGSLNNSTSIDLSGNDLTVISNTANSFVSQNTSSGIGFQASSVNGIGASFYSTNNLGLYARADNYYTAQLAAFGGATPTTVIPTLLISSSGSNGLGGDGIGTSIDFSLATSTISENSNQIISKWSNATHANRTSQLEIWGTSSAVLGRNILIDGNGDVTLDGYPSSRNDGGTSSALYVNSSGKLQYGPITGGGSGSVTNVATGLWLSGGPITTTGTIIIDSSGLSAYYLRRKDSSLFATQTQLSAKQSQLSGTGYLKFSSTTPSYLTPTQVTADLNLFTSTLQGLVPLSGGGTTNFLRADGTWAAPPSGGSFGPVSNVDGTINVATGSTTPIVSLNLSHTNSWLVPQLFDTAYFAAGDLSTKLYGFGDSYFWSVGATTADSGCLRRTAAMLAKTLTAQYNGSGEGIVEMVWQSYRNGYTQSSANAVVSLAGLNDITKSRNTDSCKRMFVPLYTAFIANTFLGTAVPGNSPSITTSGSWSTANLTVGTPAYAQKSPYMPGGGLLIYSSTAGNYATYTFSGDNVVVFYLGGGLTQHYGSLAVYVDNVYKATIREDSIGDNNTAVGAGPTATYNNQIVPCAQIFSGFGPGAHTIKLQLPAGEVRSTNIDAIGVLASAFSCAKAIVGEIPHLTATGYAAQHPSAPRTNGSVDSTNTLIDSAVKIFFTLGYPVTVMKTGTYFPATTADWWTDSLHPSNLGHLHIANGFVNTFDSFAVKYPYIYNVARDATLRGSGTTSDPLGVDTLNYICSQQDLKDSMANIRGAIPSFGTGTQYTLPEYAAGGTSLTNSVIRDSLGFTSIGDNPNNVQRLLVKGTNTATGSYSIAGKDGSGNYTFGFNNGKGFFVGAMNYTEASITLAFTGTGNVNGTASLNLQAAGVTKVNVGTANMSLIVPLVLSNTLAGTTVGTILVHHTDSSVRQVKLVSGFLRHGDTIDAIGSSGITRIAPLDSLTKDAKGLQISGVSLVPQSADGSFPGLVTTGTQTFAGSKTFSSAPTFSSLTSSGANDSVLTVDPSTGLTHRRYGIFTLNVANGLSHPTTDSLYWGNSPLIQNTTINGAGFHLNLGGSGSHISNFNLYADSLSLNGGVRFSGGNPTNANLTVADEGMLYLLPTITANRTITLPSASNGPGRYLVFINTNAADFQWSFSSTVINPDGTSVTTLQNGATYILQSHGTYGWVVLSKSFGGQTPVESGAGTLTLGISSDLIFTGSTATWTLPSLANNPGKKYYIKNAGSGNLTLQRGGSDNLWDNSSVTSVTIAAGAARIVVGGASFWYLE